MNRNIRIFIIILAILGVYVQGFSATTINSLPYTINAGGVYDIFQNLSISSGTGITINADNVTLNGHNKTITISQSGASTGILVNSNVDNFEVYDITITQDSSRAGSECIKISTSTTGINMHDLVLNVVAGGASETWGVDDRSTGSSNYFTDSTLTITGAGRYNGIESHDTPLEVSGSTFTTTNTTLVGSYPYVLIDVAGPIHDNTFNITGEKVNVIAWFGTDDVLTYNNTISYNCTKGGRIIHLDNGTSGHRVYENTITNISNNIGSDDPQIGIRVRTDHTQNTSRHWIYNNTIDSSGASGYGFQALSFGGGNYTVSEIRIYENYFKSVFPVVKFYNNNLNDFDIYCNKFEAVGSTAYSVDIGYRVDGTDIKFASNDITSERSDGKFLYVTAAATGVEFCSDDINASDISGGGSISTSSSLCGSWSCSGSPGAGGVAPPLSSSPSPPDNLRIINNL